MLEKVKAYVDFCTLLKQKTLVAARAKQLEYHYVNSKIKKKLGFAGLMPEALSQPARDDMAEIAEMYQTLGVVPDTIRPDDAVQMALLEVADLRCQNARLLCERQIALGRVERRLNEEKVAHQHLLQIQQDLQKQKPRYEAEKRQLASEIATSLEPKQEEYQTKVKMAKVRRLIDIDARPC